MATRQVVSELKGHKPGSQVGIRVLAFSADGRLLASAGIDGLVFVWDWKAREVRQRLSMSVPVDGVTFSGDTTQLAAADRTGNVSLWTVADGQILWKTRDHRGPARGVQFVPHRDDLLVSFGNDDMVRFWQVDTGQSWDRIDAQQRGVWSAQFSPDGRRLVTAGHNRTVKVWDLDQPALKRQVGMNRSAWQTVAVLRFSPDGRTLAAGGSPGPVGLWDVATTQLRATLTGHARDAYSVSLSPDGRWL